MKKLSYLTCGLSKVLVEQNVDENVDRMAENVENSREPFEKLGLGARHAEAILIQVVHHETVVGQIDDTQDDDDEVVGVFGASLLSSLSECERGERGVRVERETASEAGRRRVESSRRGRVDAVEGGVGSSGGRSEQRAASGRVPTPQFPAPQNQVEHEREQGGHEHEHERHDHVEKDRVARLMIDRPRVISRRSRIENVYLFV